MPQMRTLRSPPHDARRVPAGFQAKNQQRESGCAGTRASSTSESFMTAQSSVLRRWAEVVAPTANSTAQTPATPTTASDCPRIPPLPPEGLGCLGTQVLAAAAVLPSGSCSQLATPGGKHRGAALNYQSREALRREPGARPGCDARGGRGGVPEEAEAEVEEAGSGSGPGRPGVAGLGPGIALPQVAADPVTERSGAIPALRPADR